MKTNRKNRKGFTLAEAMMAVVVLSIASAGVILPFTGGASMQIEGARRTLSTKLAADYLEKIVATGYVSIANAGMYYELEGAMLDGNGNLLDDPIYARFSRWGTVETPVLNGVDMLWITVTVNYKGEEFANIGTLVGP
jgi:prepilin-type N-terminal cleavage/methylation domain-containing protein